VRSLPIQDTWPCSFLFVGLLGIRTVNCKRFRSNISCYDTWQTVTQYKWKWRVCGWHFLMHIIFSKSKAIFLSQMEQKYKGTNSMKLLNVAITIWRVPLSCGSLGPFLYIHYEVVNSKIYSSSFFFFFLFFFFFFLKPIQTYLLDATYRN
jgi:hypothetical protein